MGKYKQGICGYKKLAREFNLSRDTVRAWCLDPKLQSATQMAKKNKINDDKDLEYYKTAAIFWEQYAKNIEAELAKQGKKTPFENNERVPRTKSEPENSETL